MDVFLKVCEISIVVLQITNRQDFLISYDTYMSTPKRICKLQVTSRVKGTWRRKWRHCYRYIPYNRTIMELDPTGKEVFWFFFITTFTTKMKKIFACCFKNQSDFGGTYLITWDTLLYDCIKEEKCFLWIHFAASNIYLTMHLILV